MSISYISFPGIEPVYKKRICDLAINEYFFMDGVWRRVVNKNTEFLYFCTPSVTSRTGSHGSIAINSQKWIKVKK